MSEEKATLPALVETLYADLKQAKFSSMEVRSNKAVEALKIVTAIASDEQDAAAEGLLVKVRKTFELVETSRKEMTTTLDSMKKLLMEPEKAITNAVGSGNEYERVKKLRDAWANNKLQVEKARLAGIKAKQDIETEKVTVKVGYETAYDKGIVNELTVLTDKLSKAFSELTLEKCDKLAVSLAAGSVLKIEQYNAWFDSALILCSLLQPQEVISIKASVKMERTYQMAAAKYAEEAKIKMDSWAEKLPELRKAFTASKEEVSKIVEATKVEEAQKAAEQVQQVEAKAESNLQGQVLGVQFNAQIETQMGAEEISGTLKKKAVLNVANQDMVITISELFFNVFTNPKYPGIIKTDKKGVQQFNEDKTPIYVDWFESMLSFYANHCDVKIPGITITEVISTTQRKK